MAKDSESSLSPFPKWYVRRVGEGYSFDMACWDRLRSKGVLFLGFRYIKGNNDLKAGAHQMGSCLKGKKIHFHEVFL